MGVGLIKYLLILVHVWNRARSAGSLLGNCYTLRGCHQPCLDDGRQSGAPYGTAH